jgi:branched-chain amino acid transport system permease protein
VEHGVSAWRAGVALLACVLAPLLLDDYTTALLAEALILGLVAVSVALLTGVAGLPTLGQTAPFAAGAYVCAQVNLHGAAGTAPNGATSLLVGALAGAAFAGVTAPLVIHARGVVVLMITLAIGELVVAAAGRWKAVTGGTDGLIGLPAMSPLPGTAVLGGDRAVYWYTLAAVTLVLGVTALVLRGPAGPLLRACRDDEHRMRASGHPVTAYLFVAFVAAGAIAGTAGSLLVTAQRYLSPADFGFDIAALLLLGVVIGGAESLGGAIAGMVAVVAVRDWLSGVLPGQAPILLGALFVAAAYLVPRGLRLRRPRLSPPRWLPRAALARRGSAP